MHIEMVEDAYLEKIHRDQKADHKGQQARDQGWRDRGHKDAMSGEAADSKYTRDVLLKKGFRSRIMSIINRELVLTQGLLESSPVIRVYPV